MLALVTTCDYIESVSKKTAIKYPPPMPQALVLKDARMAPEAGLTVPVRTAKARLSALLEMVAAGREITITCDGRPKAVLVPVEERQRQKVFTGTMDVLRTLPRQTEGPFAEELVRADRDGRGW